jgi:hypothetical protein
MAGATAGMLAPDAVSTYAEMLAAVDLGDDPDGDNTP